MVRLKNSGLKYLNMFNCELSKIKLLKQILCKFSKRRFFQYLILTIVSCILLRLMYPFSLYAFNVIRKFFYQILIYFEQFNLYFWYSTYMFTKTDDYLIELNLLPLLISIWAGFFGEAIYLLLLSSFFLMSNLYSFIFIILVNTLLQLILYKTDILQNLYYYHVLFISASRFLYISLSTFNTSVFINESYCNLFIKKYTNLFFIFVYYFLISCGSLMSYKFIKSHNKIKQSFNSLNLKNSKITRKNKPKNSKFRRISLPLIPQNQNNPKGGPGNLSSSPSRSSSSSPTPPEQQTPSHPHRSSGGGGMTSSRGYRGPGESALLGQARGVLADMLALLKEEQLQQEVSHDGADEDGRNKVVGGRGRSLVQKLTSGLMALNDLLEPVFVGSSSTYIPEESCLLAHRSLSSMSCGSNSILINKNGTGNSYQKSHCPLRPDHMGVRGGGMAIALDSPSSYGFSPATGTTNTRDRVEQQDDLLLNYDSCCPLVIPGDRPPCHDCSPPAPPLLLLLPSSSKKSVSMRKSLPPGIARRVSSAGGLWSTTTSATGMPTLEPTPSANLMRTHHKSQIRTTSSSPPSPHDEEASPASGGGGAGIGSRRRGGFEDKDDDSGISTDTPSTNVAVAKRLLPTTSPLTPIPHPRGMLDRNGEMGEMRYERQHDDDNISSPAGILRAGQCISSQPKSCRPSSRSQVTTTNQQHTPSSHPPPPPSSSATPQTNNQKTLGVESSSINHDSGTDTAFLPSQHRSNNDSKPRKISNPRFSNVNINKTKERYDNSKSPPPAIRPSVRVEEDRMIRVYDGTIYDLGAMEKDALLSQINSWEFPIFDFAAKAGHTILSQIAYRIFYEANLFQTFDIPVKKFLNFFHALEDGYRENPYHNRIHAADVLQAVYYLTTQPVPGFREISLYGPEPNTSSQSAQESPSFSRSVGSREGRVNNGCTATGTPPEYAELGEEYGITGHNLTPLELMALYTAAAMHDYDHPGRTNAFLVTISAPEAVLYNDRSVLENHHAAASWKLYLSNAPFQFLSHLPVSEFKRFRFLVIEAILATDLKRHFEILAEFDAKISEEAAGGVDWCSESDRLLVLQMCIKIADINGPCKPECLHLEWTRRITQEFYLQGDEEASLGLDISPYMDKRFPQVSKLQESFITHLVAPLSNSFAAAGMLPGYWELVLQDVAPQISSSKVEAHHHNEGEKDKDKNANPTAESVKQSSSECCSNSRKKRCACSPLTTFLRQNHLYWNTVIKREDGERGARLAMKKKISSRSLPPLQNEMSSFPSSSSSPPPPSTNTIPTVPLGPGNTPLTPPRDTAHTKDGVGFGAGSSL